MHYFYYYTLLLPYSSGTMIPNNPSSFKPFIVSGGMEASLSILAESTTNHKEGKRYDQNTLVTLLQCAD